MSAIYFILILSLSCTKEEPLAPIDKEDPVYSNFLSRNLIWETQIYDAKEDTFGYNIGGPFLFDDKVVFSKAYFDPFPRENFVAIDVENDHSILWEVQPNPAFYSKGRRKTQKYGGGIIQPEAGYFTVMSGINGTYKGYQFTQPNYNFHARIEINDTKIYIPSTSNDLHSSILHEIDLEMNKIINLDTISLGNEIKNSFEPLLVSKNNLGKDIIYYVSRNRTLPGTGSLDMFAMDLTERNESGVGKQLWHKQDFDPLDKNCNVIAPPKIINDTLLVFLAEHHVYGIHTESGETLFKSDYFEDRLILSDICAYEEKILFLNTTRDLISISSITGEVISVTRDMGGNSSKFEIYNNVLYYTSSGDGKLYVYDLEKEEKLHALRSPHKDEFSFVDFSSTSLHIDKEKGVLYVSDRAYAMAIQL